MDHEVCVPESPSQMDSKSTQAGKKFTEYLDSSVRVTSGLSETPRQT